MFFVLFYLFFFTGAHICDYEKKYIKIMAICKYVFTGLNTSDNTVFTL